MSTDLIDVVAAAMWNYAQSRAFNNGQLDGDSLEDWDEVDEDTKKTWHTMAHVAILTIQGEELGE